MTVKRGYSEAADPAEAARELRALIAQERCALVLLFAAPGFDREGLRAAVNREFGGVTVVGCTTAGEITPDGYREHTLTGVSFGADEFRVSPVLIPDLQSFRIEDGEAIVRRALQGLGHGAAALRSPSHTFAMLLIDGLSKQEEVVVSSVGRFLDAVPLFGGSAGDGLRFGETWIFEGGVFHADAAVLTLFHTTRDFHVFKIDHFSPTGRKMVVTGADPNARLVTEINAEPAAPAYARMVGLDPGELSPMIFAAYPVVVKIGGEYHVRSIQKVEDDGSLRFYCGIDEGLVLTVASADDIARNLDQSLDRLKAGLGPVEMILGFDCILRRLEAEQTQRTRAVSEILRRHKVVGFSTYGEQFRSMHVNQTFTGVAIGAPRARAPEAAAS